MQIYCMFIEKNTFDSKIKIFNLFILIGKERKREIKLVCYFEFITFN